MPISATLKSYLYQEYADDDNLQAFIDAYNEATQVYLDWFNQTNLSFYPGLNGDLLDWVMHGLYGITRSQLETQISPALGPLNTLALNTQVLNYFQPANEMFFSLTDDVFQRILTWDFYKGDGKYFCMRWLKRRIMRFLVGANGLSPDPTAPGFQVGPENTTAISVQVAGGILTVTISQSQLTALAPVSPGIVQLFALIFQGGLLDLPAQYTYAVNITP